MPEVLVGGELAGGSVTAAEWDAMVQRTTESAFKILVSDCSGLTLGSGSGFNIGRYVVTNRHVIKDAERVILVARDGSESEAATWAVSASDDLALLAPEESTGRPAVRLAAADPVSGDLVGAIGFPLGGDILTRKARVLERLEDQDISGTYAVSTSASVQPGDSGGVLVNADGDVVAVTTAIALLDNVSLAVPVSRVHELLRSGEFTGSPAECR